MISPVNKDIQNLISENPWKHHDEMMEIFSQNGIAFHDLKAFYKNHQPVLQYLEEIKQQYIVKFNDSNDS